MRSNENGGDELSIALERLLIEAGLTAESLALEAQLGGDTVARWIRRPTTPLRRSIKSVEEVLTRRLGRRIDLSSAAEERRSRRHQRKAQTSAQGPPYGHDATEPPPIATAAVFFEHLLNDHTRLFAGRDAELRQISDCIDGDRGGYVFVEGLSGFGKTSLLANLVREHTDILYHFISQAYKSPYSTFDSTKLEALLRNVYEQYERRSHGASVDVATLEQWFTGLLNQPHPRRLIVLIDAIDEIDRHPNYLLGRLPRELPTNVTVILSARTRGDRSYLAEVGLAPTDIRLHLTLGGLDVAAVDELVATELSSVQIDRMGDEIGSRLHEVSQGDPFYLRFLIEDLAAGRHSPETLGLLPSGLVEYFDLQMAILDRTAHRAQHKDILELILAAEGPLAKSDLIRMVDGLNNINFGNTIRDISRFLLTYEDQYTFCHTRFKEYMAGVD